MHYKIFSQSPHTHFINIECTIENIDKDELILKLPVWRPGRYERVNFAKNIGSFNIVDSHGHDVPFYKKESSIWVVDTKTASSVKIIYTYFANQPDAGACFCNNEILYINPIHCCVYLDERMHMQHTIDFITNDDWQTATALSKDTNNFYVANDFHELVDSPIIAAKQMQHHSYSTHNKLFNIWIQGEFKNDIEKLIADFKLFSDLQLKVMRDIPVSEYHFLIIVTPHKFYHGVEHLKSTVLAIGNAEELLKDEWYNELIGVASHELFHVWNVKTIRPAEMLPYKYDTENYAATGYVYEGITTYYGDLFLARCGYLNHHQYLEEINTRLNKHYHNEGRLNYSVMQSSFDTWLDGYVPGVPGRKTSIYDEGSLIALILDLHIIHYSNATKSLDDVMRVLYKDFGKNNLGYKHHDIQRVCENIAGQSFANIFNNLIEKNISYETALDQALNFVGCKITLVPSKNSCEKNYGMKLTDEHKNERWRVTAVQKNSPADIGGIAVNDVLTNACYSIICDNNINHIFDHDKCEVYFDSYIKQRYTVLHANGKSYFDMLKIESIEMKTEQQTKLYNYWLGERN